jgi:hypothetical protein
MAKAFTRLLLPLLVAFLAAPSLVWGGDPTFVGKLAIVVEKGVSDQLGLADDVRAKLQDLIAERERAALELVQEIKALSPEEQKEKLAPFVAESEKQGLALLTDEQKTQLDKIQLARAGMSSLADAAIAEALGLTDEQKEKVAAHIKERDQQLIEGGEGKRSITMAFYDRKLAGILTPAMWLVLRPLLRRRPRQGLRLLVLQRRALSLRVMLSHRELRPLRALPRWRKFLLLLVAIHVVLVALVARALVSVVRVVRASRVALAVLVALVAVLAASPAVVKVHPLARPLSAR